MRWTVLGCGVLAWVFVGLGGCAFYDPVGALGDGQECVPGQVESCRCSNSGTGERTCIETGIWWGCSCTCDGIWCDGVCTAYQTDVLNCGRCGHACADGEACWNGHCDPHDPPCADGLTRCDSLCVNIDADPENCGSCGSQCGAGCLCIMGNCAGDGCPEDQPGYRQMCEPGGWNECEAGLICLEVETYSGYCLYACDYPDGTCPDGGSCVLSEAGGVCQVPGGDWEPGDACFPFWEGCGPGLDCLMYDYPTEGACHERCDCVTGEGCGGDDPDYTCSLADPESQRCWCAGP